MIHACEDYWLPDLKFGFVAAGNAQCMSNSLSRSSLADTLIDEKTGIPVEAGLKRQEDEGKAVKDTTMEVLFPNRGDTPMPCPVKTGELTGAYRDPGHDTLVFTEVPHPEAEKAQSGETILEAV